MGGEKMKDRLKKQKKFILFGCLLFIGIVGVSAATIYPSSGIGFDNTTQKASGMTSTDVQSAVEELHGMAGTCSASVIPRIISNLENIEVTEPNYTTELVPGKVFTGADPRNWIYIKENGVKVKYRIVSVGTDGTLKVIREEKITTMAFDVDDATRRKGGYCTSNYCNAWAAMASFTNGNMTGAVAGLNGNSGDSSIKEYIDNTYAPMLDDYSKIVTKTWNISGTTNNRDTLENAIADEEKTTWDGKIALLTASEYVRANSNTDTCGTLALLYSNYSTCKSTNYLFKSSAWWLLSPYSGDRGCVLVANSGGDVSSRTNVVNTYGVRPVFYLCSGLTLTGRGTSGRPFEISGSCSS